VSREEFQRTAQPQLVADVRMYETADGGRETPALPGWGCPVMVSNTKPWIGYDALPLLRDDPLLPGQKRRLGFVFLTPDLALPVLRDAGRFYLWEGRIVGEADVVS
jgi:hypothetical protein